MKQPGLTFTRKLPQIPHKNVLLVEDEDADEDAVSMKTQVLKGLLGPHRDSGIMMVLSPLASSELAHLIHK